MTRPLAGVAEGNRIGVDPGALPTRGILKRLAATEGLAVSLYADMATAGPEVRENRIRFKNRVAEAERLLRESGLHAADVETLLAPALELIGDRAFWQRQGAGLAQFIAPGEHHLLRLPLRPGDATVVGRRYYLNPLVPALSSDGRFYILAVSLGGVRLFAATRDRIDDLALEEVDGVPTSLEEALRLDGEERHLGRVDVSPGAAGSASRYFGHGAGGDERKTRILGFFQQIDRAVGRIVGDGEGAPLVFVGVDHFAPLYREANSYPRLLDESVAGSPDSWSASEVHERVWPIVERHFRRVATAALRRIEEAPPEQTSYEVDEVLLAAFDGRVDTLVLAPDLQRWGWFDREVRTVHFEGGPRADNDELINLAAIYTMIHGGSVFAVAAERLPDGAVAASLRY